MKFTIILKKQNSDTPNIWTFSKHCQTFLLDAVPLWLFHYYKTLKGCSVQNFKLSLVKFIIHFNVRQQARNGCYRMFHVVRHQEKGFCAWACFWTWVSYKLHPVSLINMYIFKFNFKMKINQFLEISKYDRGSYFILIKAVIFPAWNYWINE